MDNLFSSLKAFIKTPPVLIDNHGFRLHYRATFVILIAFSIMITSKQYFGDPIDCISKDDVPNKMLDTYCWIHTTFSVENAWKKEVGHDVPYPGVDKSTPDEKRVYHAYYQWVCFVLFFQALFFYVPRYLWKAIEGGKVAKLSEGLNSPINAGKQIEKIRQVADYIRAYRGSNDRYFYFYCFTEVLNFVNVIVQMYIMDQFLGGAFSTYGWDVINFTEWEWSVRFDPMVKVFPRLTKCTFHRYGSSGDVQKYDAMCILPINIINEKVYVALWFWFYFIAIISFICLIYRACTILFTHLRVQNIRKQCKVVDRYDLKDYLDRHKIGDWFLMQLLAKNMDPINFNQLLEVLTGKI